MLHGMSERRNFDSRQTVSLTLYAFNGYSGGSPIPLGNRLNVERDTILGVKVC
ncbi:hypothetical protein DFO66_104244 [Brevibacterium sanguinis]|uniref:Uncharacterized protein n=2 Tax=Brevibacterium TaxID=1696 RepID=A0A366ILZ4_9MICO|nr:hypothetical protein DFO66_104244 [Brevibacterium sanguinis]RBP72292.1 hypothetical protein DFO65_104250 [Brevibacterium celere]